MTSAVAETAVPPKLIALLDEALDLLDRERIVFMTGRYEEITTLNDEKLSLLTRLQDQLSEARGTPRAIAKLKLVVDASKRNQEIIAAAREGLAHAKRRLGAIRDMEKGVVAYREDGDRIRSLADLMSPGKSA